MGSTIIRTCLLSILLSGVAYAQEAPPSVFDQFSQDAGDCIQVDKIKKVAKNFAPLSNDQFQFVRAFFAAIPPVSRTLPIGDRAFIAEADGDYLLGLLSDGPKGDETCARFRAPEFLVKMLSEVGQGHTEKPGDPT